MRLLPLFIVTLILGHAAIVDRMAIGVGTKVITASEIYLRLRLTAFENGVEPSFDIHARKRAAEQLIDQKLVEREMDIGRYPRLDAAHAAQSIPEYAKTFFKSDVSALSRTLLLRGLTLADLEEDLARQADLLTFLSLRFRPAVQVSDAEVRRYFNEKVRTGPQGSAATLEGSRADIEALLTNARADTEMEAWLREQRKRAHIEYLEQDLAP